MALSHKLGRAAALLGAAVALAGCAHRPAHTQEPPRPKPNSNQNPDFDAR